MLASCRANGVPWLVWLGREGWKCEGCGAAGLIAQSSDVCAFARQLGDLKREHNPCMSGLMRENYLERDGVGNCLNVDRVER